jgi:hypothetical protein
MQYRPDPLGGRTHPASSSSQTPSSHERQREPMSMRYDGASAEGQPASNGMNAGGGGQPGTSGPTTMAPMGMIHMVQQYLDQRRREGGAEADGVDHGRIHQDPRDLRQHSQQPPLPPSQHHAYGQPSYNQHNGGPSVSHSQAGPSNYARQDGYQPLQHAQHHSVPPGHPQQYSAYPNYAGPGYHTSPPSNAQQRFMNQPPESGYPADNRSSQPPHNHYSNHPAHAQPNHDAYGRQESSQPYFSPHLQNHQTHARHPSQTKTSPTVSSQYPQDHSRPNSSYVGGPGGGPGNRSFHLVSGASSQHHSEPSQSHSLPRSTSPSRADVDDEGESARASSVRKRKVEEGSTDREESAGGGGSKNEGAEPKDANGMPTFVACTKWLVSLRGLELITKTERLTPVCSSTQSDEKNQVWRTTTSMLVLYQKRLGMLLRLCHQTTWA